MSYYPILEASGCTGQTTLFNFPPNNWEDKRKRPLLVNLTWAEGSIWRSVILDQLAFGATRTYTHADILAHLTDNALPLLSLSFKPLPEKIESLPASIQQTNTPNWRATLGLVSPFATTSYQGEIDPFPAPGSLLTFAPFIQFGQGIENYMLLLNLEKNPQMRISTVEIYDSAKPDLSLGCFEVRNNAISPIRLDGLGLNPESLPVIICKGMSGIPLFFSKTANGAHLSLEHTHPPASFVIHGKRWDAQKILKNQWFAKLGQV
jgi:hypothetical protein